MPKRIYQLGELCDTCKTPTVQGKNGVYCKPCYIAWAEKNKQSGTYVPKPQQNAPQTNFDPLQVDLDRRIGVLEATIANIRVWAQNVDQRFDNLEKNV